MRMFIGFGAALALGAGSAVAQTSAPGVTVQALPAGTSTTYPNEAVARADCTRNGGTFAVAVGKMTCTTTPTAARAGGPYKSKANVKNN